MGGITSQRGAGGCMGEREDNELKPYRGIWSYRYWLALLPLGLVMGTIAYLKAGGKWPPF